MIDADYQRALLLARIEAQRTIFGLESRLARQSFHPLGSLLAAAGVDTKLAGAVATSARSLLGQQRGLVLVPLAVAAVLALVDRLRRPGPRAAQRSGS